MRLLSADDDPVVRRLLEAALTRGGHEVVVARDGAEAWRILSGDGAPALAILDWEMPGLSGLEVCRKVRATTVSAHSYLILLTAKDQREDVVAGLAAGADEFLVKPFHAEELRARVAVGARILSLQGTLGERVRELEEALARVTELQASCPCARGARTSATTRTTGSGSRPTSPSGQEPAFSHGICPDCLKRVRQEIKQVHTQRRDAD
jgi:phosphoserine phosphatase RsbU/P